MLTFSKIEKVQFGDLVVEPKVNKENLMRLRGLEITEARIDEAREILSECFGAYATEVRNFMESHMRISDLSRLQVYLSQGASGLDQYDASVNRAIEKRMDKLMEKSLEDEKPKA